MVDGRWLARLPPPCKPLHRRLRVLDRPSQDDSPLSCSSPQGQLDTSPSQSSPTPRLRRPGPSDTLPPPSQPCDYGLPSPSSSASPDVRAAIKPAHDTTSSYEAVRLGNTERIGFIYGIVNGRASQESLMKRQFGMAMIVLAVAPATASAPSAHRVGQCMITHVKSVSARFKRDPDGGTQIRYTNGLVQIDSDAVLTMAESKKGDRVRLCIVDAPTGCATGDDRGIRYRATNLRTRHNWTTANSERSCVRA